MEYRLGEIAAICGCEFSGEDRTVGRVITDSRTFPVNGLTVFVAVRTSNRDGHAYIGELYGRGVRGFIVNSDFDTSPFGEAGFIRSSDTVAALQTLAAYHRRQFKGKTIGVTGSYGKTVVKEWIAQLTPPGVELFRSPKSYNSQIGVPLSILMITGDEDYAVIEAGISQPGEMDTLRRMIRPDIGIMTAAGKAHLENFTSVDALADEKLKLFTDCPTVIYNSHYPTVGEALRRRLPNAELIDAAGVTDNAGWDDFGLRNASIAVRFWQSEGFDISPDTVRELQPAAMRLEVKEGLYDSILVNDTYNSDINSLSIALDFLGRVAGKRPRTVILADMVTPHAAEEGNYARAASLVRESGADRFIGIGPKTSAHAGFFGSGSTFYPTVDDFLRSVTSEELSGRAILIKGGSRMNFGRVSHALELRSHTTVMEIDLDALIHNLRLCRSRLESGVGIMPMIKASAYGHGTFEIANTLQREGVDYLAVAFADEGVALRESGITVPIVVLNADADSFELMIRHRLEPEIYNFTSLNHFGTLLKRHGEQHYPVHIKLDTGMHRLGFGEKHLGELCSALAEMDGYLRVSSIFSHLAAADDPDEDVFTKRQITDFDRMSGRIADSLDYTVRRHLANTKGAERFPQAHFDMVRLGIGLYGIGMTGARKVASLKTRIVNIGEVGAGETVGYNRRGIVSADARIATIPIGYADGLNRKLGCGKWSVMVGGIQAPIVGNICMDSCMIDVTGIEGVSTGDEVVIFSAEAGNTVEDMARILETIPYEVLTTVSGRVKRIYMKE